jgi:hypothetical protein
MASNEIRDRRTVRLRDKIDDGTSRRRMNEHRKRKEGESEMAKGRDPKKETKKPKKKK